MAIPTLVRKLPEPLRKIVGDLSNTERALVGLQLRPKGRHPTHRLGLAEPTPRRGGTSGLAIGAGQVQVDQIPGRVIAVQAQGAVILRDRLALAA